MLEPLVWAAGAWVPEQPVAQVVALELEQPVVRVAAVVPEQPVVRVAAVVSEQTAALVGAALEAPVEPKPAAQSHRDRTDPLRRLAPVADRPHPDE
ncbi:MAG: hypothetical protein ACPGOY_11840 [Rhodospirillaceae bacterium]